MEKKYLSIPFDAAEAGKLRIGDYVCLTGTIYSARDAAHQRMQEALAVSYTHLTLPTICSV